MRGAASVIAHTDAETRALVARGRKTTLRSTNQNIFCCNYLLYILEVWRSHEPRRYNFPWFTSLHTSRVSRWTNNSGKRAHACASGAISEVFTAATGGVWRTSSVASWTDGTGLNALEI